MGSADEHEPESNKLGVEGNHVPGYQAVHQEHGLMQHEQRHMHEAKDFLGKLSQESNFSDQHRMDSYRHHKNMEDIHNLGVEDGHNPGSEADRQEVNSGHTPEHVKAANTAHNKPGSADEHEPDSHKLGVEDGHMPGYQGAYQQRKKGGFNEMDGLDDQYEVQHKNIHPHRQVAGIASQFFKRLSQEKNYGDNHRKLAYDHYLKMDEVCKSFGEIIIHFFRY
jgi:hypothetical protein